MPAHNNTVLARAIATSLALGAAAMPFRPVLAQESSAESTASVLEEVVVTAQRRDQVLQDVPITIQVVGNDLINDVAAENMGDLNGYVPGLVVSSDSPTQPRYQIRGIQTSDFGVGTDSAVGVYVDGVYSARSGASLLAFNDIERIEVLKGPQGTLFGRNSAAGAVSIVTRQPVNEFDAAIKLRYGDNDKRYAEGMLNTPLTDSLALRVNGVWNQSDGWIKDAATGKNLWPEDNWATRAALKWEITDKTSATLSWDHDEIDQLARPAIGLIPVPPEGVLPAVPTDPATYLDPLKAKVYNDVVGNEESRQLDGVTLFIDHDFGGVQFRSTTAWRQFDTVNREDEDGTNRLATYFDTANIEHNENWYQEFKVSGRSDRFDWVAGASYYSEDARQASDTHAYTDSIDTTLLHVLGYPPFAATMQALAAGGLPPEVYNLYGMPWREVMNNEGNFKASAVFGDVIWHATDRTNVTFGLRYTHDEKEFSWLNGPREAPELDATLAALAPYGVNPADYQFDVVFPFPPINGQVIEGQKVKSSDTWDDVSPRLVVDYKIAPDVMVFGSLAKGYKAGGYNSVQPLSKFDNEDVWNLEAGVKSLNKDLGLVMNASVFYYQYLDKQSISLVCPDNAVCQYLVDTSDQEAYGLEADIRWQPVDALTLWTNVAFIDSTYKDYVNSDGTDLSGEPTGEPKFSASLGASYVWSLGSLGQLDLSATHAYRGESRCNAGSTLQGTCQASPNFKVGEATNRTDVRLSWADSHDAWGAAFYVTNVFDERYVTGVNNLTANTFGTPFASISEPRMWGVELRHNF